MKTLILVLWLIPVLLNPQRTGEKGLMVIKHYESFRSSAYYCPAGVLTIGYGSTTNVYRGMRITKLQATELLKKDLTRFEHHIQTSTYRLLKPHEFDALSSFCFNVGYRIQGQLKTSINSGNISMTVNQMKIYSKAKIGGIYRTLPGLVKRRRTETTLYKDNILDFK